MTDAHNNAGNALSTTAVDHQALRALVAVARQGNVSRAAQQLHLSQPAVSLQLKGLSQATGLQLFTRTPHGLSLSSHGAALLPHAERALAALGEFTQAAQRLRSTVQGSMRLGTILDPEFTRLGAFLGALVEAAPQVQTELRQAMSGDVWLHVARDSLDGGFFLAAPGQDLAAAMPSLGNAVATMGIASMPLTQFTYRVLAPKGWATQVLGRSWAELAALPWLATPPASVHHRLQAQVFGPNSSTGLEPRRVALVDQEASMLDLVRSGVCLSLVRDSIAMREQQERGLVVADAVGLECQLLFIWQARKTEDPVVASALQALRSVWF
ncbi:LysR family transcriptional regulator [Curvibacter sp. CHRR-16]|uniref:LysR family transcriptional regulator n=1 Tax=Curvibacter sp. CHRR-16 TaxID=2835872 RepID=UPI001BD9C004|nr:LysR family transcriptional regulator [Curvibacter sp. CHRR-16]MBT0571725.1 LysR family transcriptional regulator [Curvibacter sp. CHRR-16]